jgi:hypothetical protein
MGCCGRANPQLAWYPWAVRPASGCSATFSVLRARQLRRDVTTIRCLSDSVSHALSHCVPTHMSIPKRCTALQMAPHMGAVPEPVAFPT